MQCFNIYLTGVGGQGIGLLSEVILRAVDHAGHAVKAVDTHGLAQRGGIVVSQIRLGTGVHTPLIAPGTSDLALALERHEALRAAAFQLRQGGTLLWYDAVWQPLGVRLGQHPAVEQADVQDFCAARGIRAQRVAIEDLGDARMQNMALLGHLAHMEIVPAVTVAHYRQAMEDLMSGAMLEQNLALFDRLQRG
jgi:indolepyruvate ferredoxin oxidoreductase beta subunit